MNRKCAVNWKLGLQQLYTLHRKKAKVIFRNDALMLERLALTGTMPRAYVVWLETVCRFYKETQESNLQAQMSRLRISPEEIQQGNTLITELEIARADYLREKGESQDATRQKDEIFAQLDAWIRDLYDVARIALEDKTQLLAVLLK
ncbi:MAG: hypothetical protein NW226_22050 [Microscillaceae bacterium]|nr:hypothetical protein [Microscillaceae bacterium]